MPGKKSAANPPIKPNDKPAANPAALSRRPVGNGIAAPIRSQVLRNPDNQPLETIVPGYAEGRLCGGNLTLIASSLGTPFALDAADSILFLEEVGEDAYRVDRLLLQLKLAGVFADCRGILLGSFHPQTLENLRIAVEELLIPERKPILGNIACGHCLPSLTLPLGARAFLDAGRGVWGIRL